MTNASIITGNDAIEFAERNGLTLSKYADPIEGAREGVSVDDAREIAREDASLIYVAVTGLVCTSDRYYGYGSGSGADYGSGSGADYGSGSGCGDDNGCE